MRTDDIAPSLWNDYLVLWEESSVFPRENAPGVFLAGARYREDLSQRALAELTGIPGRHISEMENGKRPVGKRDI